MNPIKPINRIKLLIPTLPRSDMKFAHRFLNSRDFESLQLLVNSALIRVKNGLNKETPKEEYIKVNLEKLKELKSEVDDYCEALEFPKYDENSLDFSDENII